MAEFLCVHCYCKSMVGSRTNAWCPVMAKPCENNMLFHCDIIKKKLEAMHYPRRSTFLPWMWASWTSFFPCIISSLILFVNYRFEYLYQRIPRKFSILRVILLAIRAMVIRALYLPSRSRPIYIYSCLSYLFSAHLMPLVEVSIIQLYSESKLNQ